MIERHPTPTARRPQHLYLVVLGLAIVLAAAVVIWMLVGGGSNATPAAKSGPTIVSQTELGHFASSLDYPVYWAGPKPGFSYELTATDGRVWVRYLPAGVKAGDPRPNFLVIGTYKQAHAFSGLVAAAKQPDSLSKRIADGGLLVFSSERPTSVYFGYPGVKYQVEVYAPSAKTARALVVDGKATPVR
jgi:hypothetical protein